MIGCWPLSFSSVAWLVEKPVLVSLAGRQTEVVEQDRPQLRRGVDVEVLRGGVPGRLDDRRSFGVALGGQGLVQLAQHLDVHADPQVLHAGQHPHQGDLDLVVEAGEAVRLQRRLERLGHQGDSERAPARPPGTPRRTRRRDPTDPRARSCHRPVRPRRGAPGGRRASTACRPGPTGRRRAWCRRTAM